MTPPPAAAVAAPVRRPARVRTPPARPRRVSGPARRQQPVAAPAVRSTGIGTLARRISPSRMWIPVIALAVIGLVTLQLVRLQFAHGAGTRSNARKRCSAKTQR